MDIQAGAKPVAEAEPQLLHQKVFVKIGKCREFFFRQTLPQ